jgi:hypothetical protein
MSPTTDDRSASAYFIKFRQSLFGAGVVLSKPDVAVGEGEEESGEQVRPARDASGLVT